MIPLDFLALIAQERQSRCNPWASHLRTGERAKTLSARRAHWGQRCRSSSSPKFMAFLCHLPCRASAPPARAQVQFNMQPLTGTACERRSVPYSFTECHRESLVATPSGCPSLQRLGRRSSTTTSSSRTSPWHTSRCGHARTCRRILCDLGLWNSTCVPLRGVAVHGSVTGYTGMPWPLHSA